MAEESQDKLTAEELPLSKKMSYGTAEGGDTPLLGTASEGSKYGHRGLIDGWLRPCAAEFLATTIFVAIGTLTAVGGGDLVSVSLAHGLTIALLVSAFGPISGGHVNPTVTLGCALSGATKPALAVAYVLSQLTGGMVGAAICRGAVGSHAYNASMGAATVLPDGATVGGAILCEATITMVLVITVLLTAVDTGNNVVASLVIGFAITADIFAAANVSGASANPARSFGPTVVVSDLNPAVSPGVTVWTHHYIYWIGPIIGSCVAAAFYRFLFANNEKRLVLKTD